MRKIIAVIILFLCITSLSYAQTSSVIVESELIFPLQSQHVHACSIVYLPKGDILAAWFQGSGERKADDVKIMGARLKKGESKWSEPFLMADTYNIPDCNPVLFLNHHQKLFLVWIAVQANRWEYSIIKYRTSINYENNGAPEWNWQGNILLKPGDDFAKEVASKFKQLPENTAGWSVYAPSYDDMIIAASKDEGKRSLGWETRIHPLLLPNDKILLPLYSDGLNLSLIAISDNDGATWHPSLPIVGRGNVQPSLIQKKDGSIVAYMRDNGDAPARVMTSISSDGGESWTAVKKTNIPNTASVKVLALKSGRWAFVGDDEDGGRYRLSLYLSDDEGKTWKWEMPLENVPKGHGSFSYPSMIQTPDGLLHITYSFSPEEHQESIKYIVVNPEKMR